MDVLYELESLRFQDLRFKLDTCYNLTKLEQYIM